MGKSFRRIFQNFIVLLGCALLAACGPGETGQPSISGGEELSFLSAGGGKGLEVMVERSDFYDVAPELKGDYRDGTFLGMQFYQGKPVQLWASAPYSTGSGQCVTVYMYRQDGTREICVEQIERLSGQRIDFRDSQGYCYSVDLGGENSNNSIVKLDSSGKTLYRAKIEGDRGRVEAFCELTDGRLAVLVNRSSGTVDCGVMILDDKGGLTNIELSGLVLGQPCHLGTSEEDLLLIQDAQLYRVALAEGKLEPLFSFAQTTYTIEDIRTQITFRVREDGCLEMLRSDRQGSAVCETLSLAERDESRQEVVLRGMFLYDEFWMKEQIERFNSSNDKYRVVVEMPEEWDDKDDYAARTGVELAAGKGPDILMGNLIESPGSLIEKGMLEDLAPLMEQAGIKEEDYFPIAFDTWRTGESIYGICFSSSPTERMISSAVLGDEEYPDIETLTDALLAYPENAVYYGHSSYSAEEFLREHLEGSETLWGMVDWENGTCDFGGELFGKLLEAAKRYGYDARNNYPAVSSSRYFNCLYHVYTALSREGAKAEGYVPVGKLFDDGAHPVRVPAADSFAVNVNAANKEGAWEFLRYLLGDEAQENLMERESFPELPVKKSVFWTIVEEEIESGPTEKRFGKGSSLWRSEESLPREKAEEVAELLENVRALPYKTEAILEIVLEEAQDYFDGVKEIPQVVDAVENRVGLYLNELGKKK